LETSQGTDHDNSGEKTCPKTFKSDISINLANFRSSRSFQISSLTDQQTEDGISRMRYYGAENTCKITGSESNSELGWFGIIFFSKSEDIVIEELDKSFESNKLDDGVRDLSRPKWDNTFVKSLISFFSFKLCKSCSEGSRILSSRSWKLYFEF